MTITRDMLAEAFPANKRLQRAFEEQSEVVEATAATVAGTLESTDALNEATVVVLSPNAAFANERVLRVGQGIRAVVDDDFVTLEIDPEGAASVEGGFSVLLRAQGVTDVLLPMAGTLATRAGDEILQNKTLATPKISGLGNYANDAAAAAGGVPVTGIYRNGSQLMVRVA